MPYEHLKSRQLVHPHRLHGVRYALQAVLLPSLTDAVVVGEWTRQAALSQYGQLTAQRQSHTLMGRVGRERMTGHRHAFYLPADEDGDGYLDHLTIYAPVGLTATEQAALARLERLWAGSEQPEIGLALLGLYSVDGLREAHPWFRSARVWESVTPFVLTRHPKTYRDGYPKVNDRGEQVDGPEDQARREWTALRAVHPGLLELIAVEPIDGHTPHLTRRPLHWPEYRRQRSRGKGTSFGFACGLRLTFAAPVAGPIALGYGCHYGLGQFRPVD